ncbi:MAG: hypothetical protein WC465_02855 [Patescibacteria group bacterium]
MEDKKRLTTLLIVLAIALIAGGLYLFFVNRGLDFSFLPWFKKDETTTVSQIQQIEAAKRLTEQNLQDFVRGNRLDDLASDEQYQDLQGLDVNISLDNPGNTHPFTTPSTDAPAANPGT